MLLVALALAGCSSNAEREPRKSSAEQLYEQAHHAMVSGNYRYAIDYYENLGARFPFSNQSKQAQLDLIYCYFKNGEQESAIDAARQFQRENPTHPRVDYALYMQGLANFRGQRGYFHRLFRIDLTRRPPEGARESFSAFAQLLQRYPNSPYTADARQRMIFLRNFLAEHENHVARYYLARGAYVAAINRAKFVVQNYDGSPAVADSLRIMVNAYRALGMQDLADSTRTVLAASFPDAAIEQTRTEEKHWYSFDWFEDEATVDFDQALAEDEAAQAAVRKKRWYQLWGDDSAPPAPAAEPLTGQQPEQALAAAETREKPWYKFWGDESPAAGTPALQPEQPEATQPAESTEAAEKPWYKFWGDESPAAAAPVQPAPQTGIAQAPASTTTERKPWYQFWGDADTAEPAAAQPAAVQPTTPATTETTGPRKKPWYQLWPTEGSAPEADADASATEAAEPQPVPGKKPWYRIW